MNIDFVALITWTFFALTSAQQCWVPGEVRGHTVKSTTSPSKEDCLQFCKDTPQCFWFTFFISSDFCIAFHNKTIIDTSCKECVSGEVTCSGSSGSTCYVTGECQGNLVGQSQALSYNGCLQICKDNSACNWFSYYVSNKFCVLYSTCNLDTSNTDCISGQYSCPPEEDSDQMTKILVIGGQGDFQDVEYVDLPSLIDNGNQLTVCRKVPDYPLLFEGGVAALIDGKVTVCGGTIVSGEAYRECYQLSPKDNSWSSISSMSIGRSYADSVYVPDVGWWVLGGSTNNGETLYDSTEILDTSGYWRQGDSLPRAVHGHCAVQVDDRRTFVTGGVVNGINIGSTNIYDWNTNSWRPQAEMRVARSSPACALYSSATSGEKYVLVAGGYSNSKFSKIVEKFDLNSMTWKTGPSLPMELAGATLVKDNEELILVGGYQNNELYRFNGSAWIRLNDPYLNVPNRLYASILAVPDTALSDCIPTF